MFSKAYELASQYTHPVIVSKRRFDKTVESELGSFVILNHDGWIITAAHILDPAFAHEQDAKEIKEYTDQVESIRNNPRLNDRKKQKQLKNINTNNKWITNYSFWWGHDIFKINHFEFLRENDLAIGKIENYNKSFQKVYPKLKNPDNMKYATSLCKLGYPFYSIKTEFIESSGSFKLDPNVLPVPRFPIEGIFTRNINAGKSKDGKFDIKFLETSTPGLKGQSGGPTFDTNGNLWAIQSRTQHLDLGFSPQVEHSKEIVEAHQFLNVGWGIHIDTIIKFLEEKNVSFKLSEE